MRVELGVKAQKIMLVDLDHPTSSPESAPLYESPAHVGLVATDWLDNALIPHMAKGVAGSVADIREGRVVRG
jgi:hypothetical protein